MHAKEPRVAVRPKPFALLGVLSDRPLVLGVSAGAGPPAQAPRVLRSCGSGPSSLPAEVIIRPPLIAVNGVGGDPQVVRRTFPVDHRPAVVVPRVSPVLSTDQAPEKAAARTPRSANSCKNANGSATITPSPPEPGRASRPCAAQPAATAATAPAATAGRSRAPSTTASVAPSRRPRISTRMAPMAPSAWGRAQHRQAGSHPISTRGAHPCRDPRRPGEGGQQEHRVGEFGSVTVEARHRVGEPAQLATRTGRPAHPRPITPVDGLGAQRSVMLSSAGGTTGAGLGHVDLVDGAESDCGVAGQETAEPGRERGASDDVATPLAGFGVEVEEAADLGEVVAGRDHIGAPFERSFGHDSVVAGRGGHDHDGGIVEQLRTPCGGRRRPPQRPGHLLGPGHVAVGKHEFAQPVKRVELPSGSGPDGAGAHKDDSHAQRRSGPVSSRQPPFWGGTPPVPRRRRTPATMPAVITATTARRIALTAGTSSSEVGLDGIEPSTSALSVLRSNQLSYSPAGVTQDSRVRGGAPLDGGRARPPSPPQGRPRARPADLPRGRSTRCHPRHR